MSFESYMENKNCEGAPLNQPPSLNITDLCNDVLIEIFSYLDLYDRTIILPTICKRFEQIACHYLPKIKEMNSSEFLTKKWKSQKAKSIFKVFRKIGPGLNKFNLNSSVATKKKQIHFKLMLKSIREHCLSINRLNIIPLVHVHDIKNLPTSIQTFVVKNFHGQIMDLKYLQNLEILHVGFEYLPERIEIKINKRLKESKISLNLNEIPIAISTVNQLSSISDEPSVALHLNCERIEHVRFDFLDKFLHLKKLVINSAFQIDAHELNKMLTILAKNNTVENLHMCCVLNANPFVEPKTVSFMMSQWIILREICITYSDFTHPLVYGLVNVLKLKKVCLHYVHQRFILDSRLAIDLSKEKLIDVMEHFSNIDVFHYFPNDTMFLCKIIRNQNEWNIFRDIFLKDAPNANWTGLNPSKDIYVEIVFE